MTFDAGMNSLAYYNKMYSSAEYNTSRLEYNPDEQDAAPVRKVTSKAIEELLTTFAPEVVDSFESGKNLL